MNSLLHEISQENGIHVEENASLLQSIAFQQEAARRRVENVESVSAQTEKGIGLEEKSAGPDEQFIRIDSDVQAVVESDEGTCQTDPTVEEERLDASTQSDVIHERADVSCEARVEMRDVEIDSMGLRDDALLLGVCFNVHSISPIAALSFGALRTRNTDNSLFHRCFLLI
jgi:hypothetical protein